MEVIVPLTLVPFNFSEKIPSFSKPVQTALFFNLRMACKRDSVATLLLTAELVNQ